MEMADDVVVSGNTADLGFRVGDHHFFECNFVFEFDKFDQQTARTDKRIPTVLADGLPFDSDSRWSVTMPFFWGLEYPWPESDKPKRKSISFSTLGFSEYLVFDARWSEDSNLDPVLELFNNYRLRTDFWFQSIMMEILANFFDRSLIRSSTALRQQWGLTVVKPLSVGLNFRFHLHKSRRMSNHQHRKQHLSHPNQLGTP
jgi:hypothetical protein